MSAIVIPAINGLGTPEAESFLSLLHRTASVYQVSFWDVLRLLNAVSGCHRVHHASYSTPSQFVGHSPSVRRLSDSLVELSGREEVRYTTFCKLSSVVALQAKGAYANAVRWCPDCLHPERGTGYGLVAHQLRSIRHCPIHMTPLNDVCCKCGSHVPLQRFSPLVGSCWKCGSPLWTQRTPHQEISSYAKWSDYQARDLVRYATDPLSQMPPANWGELFWRGLNHLSDADPKAYTAEERHLVREKVKPMSFGRMKKPSVDTLLRIASAQAVGVVDLIEAPVEHCSPRLFRLDGVPMPRVRRRVLAAESWAALKLEIEKLLETDEHVPLPPKATLFFGTGMTSSGFWQHFRELSVAYQRERERRIGLRNEASTTSSIRLARRLVSRHRERGRDVQIRRGGAVIMRALGVSKGVAEGAMHSALAIESGFDRVRAKA